MNIQKVNTSSIDSEIEKVGKQAKIAAASVENYIKNIITENGDILFDDAVVIHHIFDDNGFYMTDEPTTCSISKISDINGNLVCTTNENEEIEFSELGYDSIFIIYNAIKEMQA